MSEPAGGFQDPEEVFGKMFGGDRFEELIGQISIGESIPGPARQKSLRSGSDMKEAFQTEDELQEGDIVIGPDGKPKLSPAAQARKTARDREKSEAVSLAIKAKV